MDDTVLESFTVRELIEICGRAAERFIRGTLPIGDAKQSFDDYVRCLSATTGMPVTYCRSNAQKIHRVLAEMDTIISGLTRGFDLEILDRGYGTYTDERFSPSPSKGEGRGEGQSTGMPHPSPGLSPRGERGKHTSANGSSSRTLSFFREGRVFGAVLPSNSPGVHGLWIPTIALKAPIVLKPGREEPWTPLRIIEALAAEGIPRAALGFYPTDHAGAGELLRAVDRAMLFGDSSTTATWANDPRIEIHGPGYSKVILGDDAADDWKKYIDVMLGSIAANGGRSCINASAIWTPKHGREVAEALAKRLAKVTAIPVDDPNATIAAFANAGMAERISAMIDGLLRTPGATDVTEQIRGAPRLVKSGRVAYLLPTIIWCEDREHPLANREFLFPFASVVECPTAEMPEAIGASLVVSAITEDRALIRSLMSSGNVDRLNIGAIPTYQLSWDQPHEGNLFEHLYRQRAFQTNVELRTP
ncbi:MAG: aldehyde dehydrogenase [Planctomycetes bacterium]|nr:aldehyde dehydrogenase [Planctomycetota bacterium]MBI3835801.1 aldehyde dehydrogenase [Planctomycetota bacterium]